MLLPRITFWLLAIGGMLALATSFTVYNSVVVAVRSNGYTKQVFVVDRVGEARGKKPGGGKGMSAYFWAEGRVQGQEEKISLRGFDYRSDSLSELRTEFPSGRKVDIWYNPTAPNIVTQGKKLRALSGNEDLSRAGFKALITAASCFGPIFLGGVGFLLCRRRGITVRP